MKRLAFALLLFPSLAFAQAYRVGSGIQIVPRLAEPSHVATNGTLWINSATNALTYTNVLGVSTALGAGGGGGSSYYQTVEANTVDQAQRDQLNFSSSFSLADSSSPSRTTVSLASTDTVTQSLQNKTLVAPVINGATSASGNFNLSGSSGTFSTTSGASTFAGSLNTFINKLIPSVDNAIDLGDLTHRFRTAYIATVNGGSDHLSLDVLLAKSIYLMVDTVARLTISNTAITAAVPIVANKGGTVDVTTAPFSIEDSTGPNTMLTATAGNITVGNMSWNSGDGWSVFSNVGGLSAVFAGPVYTSSTIGTDGSNQHAMPSGTGALVSTDASQTLTNKTITAPVFSGTATGTYTLGGTPTVSGYGYIGMSDQAALGAASTSSTTFADVGNGTSTGFASWTAPATPVTKTYLLHVTVRTFMSAIASSATTHFQVLQDGVAIAGQPTNMSRGSAGATNQYLTTTWTIAVPCTATVAHVYKLQWRTGNVADTANVTTTVGQLQFLLTGG